MLYQCMICTNFHFLFKKQLFLLFDEATQLCHAMLCSTKGKMSSLANILPSHDSLKCKRNEL